MHNNSMTTLAGIVLYDPDIFRLKENIESVIEQVDKVLLVDNKSKNITMIEEIIVKNYPVVIIHNEDNMGIARALNQIFEYAIEEGYSWVLTLDQDSVCQNGLIAKYKEQMKFNYAGMFTCVIEDRNITVDNELGDESEKHLTEIKRCITSGAWCSVSAYKTVEGFDDRLFIDWVDYDYCARLRLAGYSIYRIPYKGLIHEIGKGRTVKILGRNMNILNESPLRVYYRIRNTIYVCNNYKQDYGKSHAFKTVSWNVLLIILYEKNKLKKLKAVAKGIIDSKNINRSYT